MITVEDEGEGRYEEGNKANVMAEETDACMNTLTTAIMVDGEIMEVVLALADWQCRRANINAYGWK